MYFRQILHEDRSCASYLVGCPSMGLCAVVDPQGEPQKYSDLAEANAMVVSHVIDTHIHADHASNARELAASVGADLYLGAGAEVGFPHLPLQDGDLLEVGNRRIEVIHTPGHTPEHVCLLVDDWFILTGDTLFVGDVGRVDLALSEMDEAELTTRAKSLYSSLQRLTDLPDDVEVYPGHYAGSTCGRGMDGKTITTVGHESRFNSALKLDADEFIDFQLTNVPPLPQDFDVIKRSNIALD